MFINIGMKEADMIINVLNDDLRSAKKTHVSMKRERFSTIVFFLTSILFFVYSFSTIDIYQIIWLVLLAVYMSWDLMIKTVASGVSKERVLDIQKEINEMIAITKMEIS